MKPLPICCHFAQTVPLGIDQGTLLQALQAYVDERLGPVWGVACQLHAGTPQPGEVALRFLDDADQAGALGYHDDPGTPEGLVFVRTSLDDGEPVSVTASHELSELLIDPGANLAALSPRGHWVAYEVCDPVEGDFLPGPVPLASFVHPAWFGGLNPPGVSGYDALGHCTQPWQVLRGGYVPVWSNGQWSNLFGSVEKAGWYAAQDRRLRRSDRRRRRAHRVRGGADNLVSCCGV